ncbi:ABC transporter substrate-binding protein [Cellulosimicrobium funkei]|nr:ABC transporter substrate-binding protein [Cellulosimicrobium funkei]
MTTQNHPARRTRRTTLWLAVAPLTLALAACSPAGQTASTGPVEKEGGTLTYLDAEASRSTQLQGAGTWQDSAYVENVTDRLVWKDPETGELLPYIAESWDVSEDGLTYEFTIRPGVTYSDGTPLDAASVQRNLQWQADGDEAKGIQPNNQFPAVESVESEGDTVAVALEHPYAEFLDVLSGWSSSLVADATIEASLEEQQQITGLIGSGPFVVESEKYGEEIVFAKREGYDWAPEGVGHEGEAYLDRVVVRAVTDDTVRIGTFRSGQADAIRYIQPSDETQLAEQGAQIISAQGLGATNQWILKQQIPALQDVRVRQAIRDGIDRERIVEDLYTENWDVAQSIVTEDAFGFQDASEKLQYDPDHANQLLDEAGYTERDGEGYRVRDGEQLHLITVIDVYDSTARPLYQLVQAQLKALGVNLELRDADYSQVSAAYAAEDVAATRSGWPYPAPWATLRTSWDPEGTNGFALPSGDAKLEELFEAQATETDPAEREEILGELQDHVIDEAYSVPLIKDSQIFAVQPTVHDFGFSAEARPLFYGAWTEEK